jgi:hypothetical protein
MREQRETVGIITRSATLEIKGINKYRGNILWGDSDSERERDFTPGYINRSFKLFGMVVGNVSANMVLISLEQ